MKTFGKGFLFNQPNKTDRPMCISIHGKLTNSYAHKTFTKTLNELYNPLKRMQCIKRHDADFY